MNIMQTNNHKIVDYDAVLDYKFGKEGTPSRKEAEEKAFAFYTSQIECEETKQYAEITEAVLQ